MAESYIISIDQSTQGTKALLFDQDGMLLQRKDLPHKQMINEKGWVSHDPEEIYQNAVQVVKNLVEASGISKESVKGIGISNQRETSLVWEKETGKAIAHAVVWQCARAAEICRRVEKTGAAEMIRKKTGLALSPYFPASKLAWLKENVEGAEALAKKHALCFGTIDTWLVYRMTHGTSYKTDYSNASRTQLFDIFEQRWDEEICQLFGLDAQDLAEVCDSDSCFGETDLDGFFEKPVPIHSVLGDSHGALFGQGCLEKGMIKSTYGTGSSIMMNIGETPVLSTHGVVTSLAWGMQGKINYVLEGNINYTGAVITWLKDDMELIQSPAETEELCRKAEADDSLYFVPAFTGLGAPHWDQYARGTIVGITRGVNKYHIIRATLESLAYQVNDVLQSMKADSGIQLASLKVDGGASANDFLMQTQADIINAPVNRPRCVETTAMGAAYLAGLAVNYWTSKEDVLKNWAIDKTFTPQIMDAERGKRIKGWEKAVKYAYGWARDEED